ncbi:MAG: ferritin-like domain-containing protein [Sandaracinaceae bacterium]|nr:ferritin-like domain-containing protein [Sandaracinaceae bacterium]
MRLRPEPSGTALAQEWDRLLRTALRRGSLPEELEPTIDVAGLDPRAVDAARRGWLRRMVDEHRSATVFSGLLPQLIEAELPVDVQAVALRMAMDELRHGTLCGAVARALGVDPVMDIADASEGPARHPDLTPLPRLLRNVIYASCVSETVSVALTAAEREEVDAPFVRAVLDQLFGDETLHARFGWICLAEAAPRLTAAEREAVEVYVPVAIAHYERSIDARIGAPDHELEPTERRDRARLGVLDPALAREILYDTTRDVIVPRLRDAGLRV